MRAKAPRISTPSAYGARDSSLARKLREATTEAEAQLWHHLRKRSLQGAKFRRQQALGPYVLDFYCHDLGLVVEVDGGQHFEPENEAADRQRTEWLEARGLRVLRFTNSEVLSQTDEVLEQILSVAEGLRGSPSPGCRHPLPEEGEGIEDAPA